VGEMNAAEKAANELLEQIPEKQLLRNLVFALPARGCGIAHMADRQSLGL